jgi:hypothetical protein
VLEESAARLISDLRAVTDECVARIERACAESETRAPVSSRFQDETSMEHRLESFPSSSVPVTNESGATCVEAASECGLTTGEVQLLQGLNAIRKN